MPADKAFVIDTLEKMGKYLEITGENPFKTRAYFRAAESLEAEEEELGNLIQTGKLGNLDGVGGALKEKIKDLYETGTCDLWERLQKEVPDGVGEMLKVKGLGPKKIAHIWMKMHVTSLGELLYACQENRLKDEKGFGVKTQESIRASIEFFLNQQGFFHFYKIREAADVLEGLVRDADSDIFFQACGELRRCMPVLSSGEFIAEKKDHHKILEALKKDGRFTHNEIEKDADVFEFDGSKMEFRIHFTEHNPWLALYQLTGNEKFLKEAGIPKAQTFNSEKEVFEAAGLHYVEPEMREFARVAERARKSEMPELLRVQDIKGQLHNHSTWSDGLHSIEEMATFCIQSGWEYFGISDHSQTAAYAGGLSEGRVEQQHIEIDKLNKKFAPFRILKGIESDILTDGSLDYPSSVLKTFDFIVASVHSVLNMTEEKANERLIAAIENPYTTILGHPTGRLLLSRKGYPLDHKKIIDACAANGVFIEINANPYRLDLDWTWIPYAMEKGVMLSINPDAHKREGLNDIRWGVAAARKGGLTPEMTLNALSLEDLLKKFNSKK